MAESKKWLGVIGILIIVGLSSCFDEGTTQQAVVGDLQSSWDKARAQHKKGNDPEGWKVEDGWFYWTDGGQHRTKEGQSFQTLKGDEWQDVTLQKTSNEEETPKEQSEPESVVEKEPEKAPEKKNVQESEQPPLEYKLAVINKGSGGAQDDTTVIEFRNLLMSLDKKCEERPQKIADISVTAQNLLREAGINLTLLKVIRDLNGSIPPSDIKLKLVEVAAAYVTLVVENY